MSEMGAQQAIRQSCPNAPLAKGAPLVAFDFDGTLTVRDSFTALLRWRAGAGGWIAGLARMTPDLIAYIGDRDRGRLKAASVREFLKGASRAELEAEAERFAQHAWRTFMRPDALASWEDWGQRGAHRVIVTASPAITVAPFARRLGAEALLGTELAFDADDRITGAFDGENCRGQEKVRRLEQAYGRDLIVHAAYGDTSGDAEMLAIAREDAGFRRFTGRP